MEVPGVEPGCKRVRCTVFYACRSIYPLALSLRDSNSNYRVQSPASYQLNEGRLSGDLDQTQVPTFLPQRRRVAHVGALGFTLKVIPASAGSRLPLRWLQPSHDATVFVHRFLPPREVGVMWSMVVPWPPQ